MPEPSTSSNVTHFKTIGVEQVIQEEKAILLERRKKLGLEHGEAKNPNWYGISMSGGGIRSAIINMGILKTLNRFGLLEKADYLSTVSGGGYCGAYIQTTLRALANKGGYAQLFHDKYMEALRSYGEYLVPGTRFKKKWNQLLLVISYLISTLMSFVSPAIVILIICLMFEVARNVILFSFPDSDFAWQLYFTDSIDEFMAGIKNSTIVTYALYALIGVIVLHFISNIFLNFSLHISKRFNQIENILASALLMIVLAGSALMFISKLVDNTIYSERILPLLPLESNNPEFQTSDTSELDNLALTQAFLNDTTILIFIFLLLCLGLYLLGYFTNPNALSFHRYYRKQLSDCFLQFATLPWKNRTLKDFFNVDLADQNKEDCIAPYPLINTCLNLLDSKDDSFAGTKSSDFFILSPLYCGSKITNYVATNSHRDHKNMTLPAATTISAAAVNPGMGNYSSPVLSAFMTIFNARLGFWITNPKYKGKRTYPWWPAYFFKELFGFIGTSNWMVNISDGAHIENFGAYELIRRRCSLILCNDCGEDPAYVFEDLERLIVRARNELGVEIRFREGSKPEQLIRPEPSVGYSRQQFAIADMYLLMPDEKIDVDFPFDELNPEKNKFGTFVFIKSSILPPNPLLEKRASYQFSEKEDQELSTEAKAQKSRLREKARMYKIFHPEFPHEATIDQFFDEVQWESYFQLGQSIGAALLGVTGQYKALDYETAPKFTVEQLIEHFSEGGKKLFEVHT